MVSSLQPQSVSKDIQLPGCNLVVFGALTLISIDFSQLNCLFLFTTFGIDIKLFPFIFITELEENCEYEI